MEHLLEAGDEAVEPVLAALDRALRQVLPPDGQGRSEEREPPEGEGPIDDEEGDDEEDPLMPLWALVVLGELGDPAALPSLAETIRRGARESYPLPLAAAEAMAKIGPAALPTLESLAADPDPTCRIWAYGVMGWIRHDAAYEFLIQALSRDAECLDALGAAIQEHRRTEAIPLLYEALQRAEPWQRLDVEGAIRDLQMEDDLEPLHEQDWRLRYRPEPRFGAMVPGWPAVAVIARDEGVHRDRDPVPLRSLKEILADVPPRDEEPELCECCGEPWSTGAGVPVCPATAVVVTMIQHAVLGRYRDEYEFDDLFEVMTEVEYDWMEALDRPEPRSRRGRDEREDRLTELHMVREACRWLIERGVESVGGGRAALLAEAQRLAHELGDPEGIFAAREPVKTQGPEVGRNDPCPCGSGRKYKKCCGHPKRAGRPSGPAAHAQGGRGGSGPKASGEVGPAVADVFGSGMPRLSTFDGEPVSFGRAHYRMTDPEAVRDALRSFPDLDENPEDGSFTWFRRIDDDERRVLGGIRLEGDKLTLECMSDERLIRGKALLQELAEAHLVHRLDTAQDPWQAVDEARPTGGRGSGRRSEDDIPPEIEAQLIQKVLGRHYSTWPDEPLPALDGRTARECVKTAKGRRDVAALLQSMDEMEARKPPTQRYDFGSLWAELGIEDLR